jgi:hypothetical protein
MRKTVDFWVNLIDEELHLTDAEQVRRAFYAFAESGKLQFFTEDETGVFAYVVTDDLRGGKTLAELIFYILPKYRGDIRLVKKYIQHAEMLAKENSCNSIKIGGNIGFKDAKFLGLLKRWGYVDDTVTKGIV